MEMEIIKFRIKGHAPCMMQNERLANPLDPIAKEIKKITSKRKKTDADYEEIFRLEYLGNLYCDPKLGPYWPAQNIDRLFVDGGKKTRRGTDIKEAFMCIEDINPLIYDGPRTPEQLYEDKRFVDIRSVVIRGSRTMRCRPIFRDWELEFTAMFDPEVLNHADLVAICVTAGQRVGLSTFRPRFGRFGLTAIDDIAYQADEQIARLLKRAA